MEGTYPMKKVRLEESPVMGICIVHEDGTFFEYCKEANAYINATDSMDVMWSFAKEKSWDFQVSKTAYAKRFGELLFFGRDAFMKKYGKREVLP